MVELTSNIDIDFAPLRVESMISTFPTTYLLVAAGKGHAEYASIQETANKRVLIKTLFRIPPLARGEAILRRLGSFWDVFRNGRSAKARHPHPSS